MNLPNLPKPLSKKKLAAVVGVGVVATGLGLGAVASDAFAVDERRTDSRAVLPAWIPTPLTVTPLTVPLIAWSIAAFLRLGWGPDIEGASPQHP